LHSEEVNLVFLRSEVIRAEGNLLFCNFSQFLVIVVLVRVRTTFSQITLSEWQLEAYFVKTMKCEKFKHK
jgi:hypothetical protein